MRCAIYCRLSREDEEKVIESESMQNQKSLLLNYAKEQAWEIAGVYCDEDYSGADRNRPEFGRMLREARQGAFEIILCKTQSRFTRDMELVERYIHGLFPLWGIRFVAIADHIDTSLQGNKKARQINGLVNEWYLEDLSENIRMVLDHKRRQGQHIGGFPLYGYQKHPREKGRLIVDPQAAAIVRQIFSWAAQGLGKQRIAQLLNDAGLPNPTHYKLEQGSSYRHKSAVTTDRRWNRSTVGRILKNEMYLGIMVQGRNRKVSYKSDQQRSVPPQEWFRVADTHEAIVDRATFDAVQSLHQQRAKSDGSGEIHPLAGLVHCHHCGAVMHKHSYEYKGIRRSYLRCRQKSCACSVRLEDLTAYAEYQIRTLINQWYAQDLGERTVNAELDQPDLESKQQELEILQTRLKTYSDSLQALYLDKVSGFITPEQFQELSCRLSESLTDLRRQEAALQQAIKPTQCNRKAPFPIQAERPVPRALLLCLIQSIEVSKRHGTQQALIIHWAF